MVGWGKNVKTQVQGVSFKGEVRRTTKTDRWLRQRQQHMRFSDVPPPFCVWNECVPTHTQTHDRLTFFVFFFIRVIHWVLTLLEAVYSLMIITPQWRLQLALIRNFIDFTAWLFRREETRTCTQTHTYTHEFHRFSLAHRGNFWGYLPEMQHPPSTPFIFPNNSKFYLIHRFIFPIILLTFAWVVSYGKNTQGWFHGNLVMV